MFSKKKFEYILEVVSGFNTLHGYVYVGSYDTYELAQEAAKRNGYDPMTCTFRISKSRKGNS